MVILQHNIQVIQTQQANNMVPFTGAAEPVIMVVFREKS